METMAQTTHNNQLIKICPCSTYQSTNKPQKLIIGCEAGLKSRFDIFKLRH